LLATGLSALLNIGGRAAGGQNGNQYRPGIEEEAAREAGQDIQHTAKGIVDQTLRIPPTVTVPAGTEVTVSFADNLSLATPPPIVK
jgi:type IV secretory pathway VirB10-like protein